MNIPGFTAEATLYKTVSSYRLSSFIHTEIGLNVTPQFPLNWYEVWCRRKCYTRFRSNTELLKACLAECG
jgi:hypothetical protein